MNMFRRSRVSHSSDVSGDRSDAVNSSVYGLHFRNVPDSSVDGLDASSERINCGRGSSLACYLIVMFIVLFVLYVIHSSLYGVNKVTCKPQRFDRFFKYLADTNPSHHSSYSYVCVDGDPCVKGVEVDLDDDNKYDVRFGDVEYDSSICSIIQSSLEHSIDVVQAVFAECEFMRT